MNNNTTAIIVTRNRSNLFTNAVNSALTQTCPNLEIVLFVNGSEDETEQIAKTLYKDRVKIVISKSNVGLSEARNQAFLHTKSKYIAFLDDDDTWEPQKIITQQKAMESKKDKSALNYTWSVVHKSGNKKEHLRPTLSGNIFRQSIETQPITNSSTWLVKRDAIDRTGGFDPNIWRGVDGDFIRNFSLHGFEVSATKELLTNYHENHNFPRITTDFSKALEGELIKLRKYETQIKKHPKQYTRLKLKIAKTAILANEVKTFQKYISSSLPGSLTSRALYSAVYHFLKQAACRF